MSAVDLPVELCHAILEHALQASLDGGGFNIRRIKAVLVLYRCALTCRYWADICRSFIFSHITVRTRKDLHALAAILASRAPREMTPVAHYIRHLILQQSGLEAYWVSETPQVLSCAFTYGGTQISVRLTLDGTCFHEMNTRANAIVQRLPSLLLPRLPFVELTLANIRLHSFTELARIIRHCSGLRFLRCQDLVWSTDIDTTIDATLPVSLRMIRMINCSKPALALWMVLGWISRITSNLGAQPLNLFDMTVAVELVTTVHQIDSTTRQKSVLEWKFNIEHKEVSKIPPKSVTQVTAENRVWNNDELVTGPAPKIVFLSDTFDSSSSTSPSDSSYIRCIILLCADVAQYTMMSQSSAVMGFMQQFPRLRRVIWAFGFREETITALSKVDNSLLNSHLEGKVGWAYRDVQNVPRGVLLWAEMDPVKFKPTGATLRSDSFHRAYLSQR